MTLHEILQTAGELAEKLSAADAAIRLDVASITTRTHTIGDIYPHITIQVRDRARIKDAVRLAAVERVRDYGYLGAVRGVYHGLTVEVY